MSSSITEVSSTRVDTFLLERRSSIHLNRKIKPYTGLNTQHMYSVNISSTIYWCSVCVRACVRDCTLPLAFTLQVVDLLHLNTLHTWATHKQHVGYIPSHSYITSNPIICRRNEQGRQLYRNVPHQNPPPAVWRDLKTHKVQRNHITARLR